MYILCNSNITFYSGQSIPRVEYTEDEIDTW